MISLIVQAIGWSGRPVLPASALPARAPFLYRCRGLWEIDLPLRTAFWMVMSLRLPLLAQAFMMHLDYHPALAT
jgi:hypothetical protein